MKGRQVMGKAVETFKNNTSGVIRTIVALVTIATVLTTSVMVGGMRIQRTESNLENVCNTVTLLAEKQEKHEGIIDDMRRKQAFQEGVVNTKLDTLDRRLNNIDDNIKTLLENLELVKE